MRREKPPSQAAPAEGESLPSQAAPLASDTHDDAPVPSIALETANRQVLALAEVLNGMELSSLSISNPSYLGLDQCGAVRAPFQLISADLGYDVQCVVSSAQVTCVTNSPLFTTTKRDELSVCQEGTAKVPPKMQPLVDAITAMKGWSFGGTSPMELKARDLGSYLLLGARKNRRAPLRWYVSDRPIARYDGGQGISGTSGPASLIAKGVIEVDTHSERTTPLYREFVRRKLKLRATGAQLSVVAQKETALSIYLASQQGRGPERDLYAQVKDKGGLGGVTFGPAKQVRGSEEQRKLLAADPCIDTLLGRAGCPLARMDQIVGLEGLWHFANDQWKRAPELELRLGRSVQNRQVPSIVSAFDTTRGHKQAVAWVSSPALSGKSVRVVWHEETKVHRTDKVLLDKEGIGWATLPIPKRKDYAGAGGYNQWTVEVFHEDDRKLAEQRFEVSGPSSYGDSH